MENTKSSKKVNKKQIAIAGGFLLMLFSICLIVNVGAPIRVFSFVPFYTFGAASYAFYLFLYIEGIFLVGKRHAFKIKPIRRTLGLLIIFIGFAMLMTIIGRDNTTYLAFSNDTTKGSVNFVEEYNNLFTFTSGNYITVKAHEIFANTLSYGGGILGYSLVAFFNNFMFKFAGLVFAILIVVGGLTLIVFPTIKRMIKSRKEKVKKKKLEESEKSSSIQTINVKASAKKEKIMNIDPIKTAHIIDDNYHSEITEIRPVLETAQSNDPNVNNFGGGVRKARFGSTSQAFEGVRKNGTISIATFPGIKKLEPEPAPEEPENRVNEQLELDFEATPEDDNLPFEESNILEEPEVEEIAPKNGPEITSFEIKTEENHIPEYVTSGSNFDGNYNNFASTSNNAFNDPSTAPESTAPQKKEPIQEEPKPVKRERVVWVQPDASLLDTYETFEAAEKNRVTAEERTEIINTAFQDFRIGAHVESYTIGPSVTRYNIAYESHVFSKQVANIIEDIAIRLKGASCRFERIVEGQTTSGIEVPNSVITTVGFNEVYEALPDVKKHPLAFAFGKNINGQVVSVDLNKCPHMLISGTTGSGKSIYVNSVITTLIMRNSPDDLKIVLVDPKKVEMARYADMPHLLCPIITEAEEAKLLVDKLVEEMERRYDLFKNSNGATDIEEYNDDCREKGLELETLPYIVAVLDEYADIVENCKEISIPIVALAAKARACGIHLIICTQRPSTNVVTGVIKANLPTHVALMTSSAVDSMTIIGEGGAEKLLGKGDMLVQSALVSRNGVVRLQGCYISRKEALRVVGDLKERYETHYDEKYLNLMQASKQEAAAVQASPEFVNQQENGEEARYQSIKEWVMAQQYMSISRIQRECSVGFNRAGRFFLRLQNEGIVDTVTDGNKGCRVLVNDYYDDDNDNIPTSVDQTSFGED